MVTVRNRIIAEEPYGIQYEQIMAPHLLLQFGSLLRSTAPNILMSAVMVPLLWERMKMKAYEVSIKVSYKLGFDGISK
ncbi:hypothetical protein L195_g050118 [Trifolium pratense]|uniref:Uncharacterized protein n=1 Tax=Trifolium pratense TaxID=57577 RepID=A0A2K3JS87_TRIPR|nr:hypothetical protein L195_g050118 [Trifolium pratense]